MQVVGTERRGNREARRTGPARRLHPGLASIHRVTAAILGSAIPAPSPASSTSKNSGKNHMSSVLVPLYPQRRKRTPWPLGLAAPGKLGQRPPSRGLQSDPSRRPESLWTSGSLTSSRCCPWAVRALCRFSA